MCTATVWRIHQIPKPPADSEGFGVPRGDRKSMRMLSGNTLKRTVLLGVMAVVAMFLPPVDGVFAQSYHYPYWEMGPGMMGGFGGWFGGIFMILFWILVLVAMVLVIRWLLTGGGTRTPGAHRPNSNHTTVESALDILKKRYAKGEITKEQFEVMRRDLE